MLKKCLIAFVTSIRTNSQFLLEESCRETIKAWGIIWMDVKHCSLNFLNGYNSRNPFISFNYKDVLHWKLRKTTQIIILSKQRFTMCNTSVFEIQDLVMNNSIFLFHVFCVKYYCCYVLLQLLLLVIIIVIVVKSPRGGVNR